MRTRLQTLLPSVLALTLVSLLAAPLAALAQSGASAISMYPETAGPGSTVEVTGIDFPPERVVEVQLMTPDGTVPLTTATTSTVGDFRQIVALPMGVTDGAWELQAKAADGTTSTFSFVTTLDAAVGEPGAADEAASPAPTGNSSGDIALMLIVAVVLGGIAFGVMIVYRQIKDESPPGMGRGDDLIWGGGTPDGPEQTATEEPHWKNAQAAANTSAATTAQSES
jgi:hypothetical protein